MTNPLRELNAAGQSVWYDHIRRSMLDGELQTLIERDDLRGMTSNPTIFEQALRGQDYDNALQTLLRADPQATPRELFYRLAIDDIRTAADRLLPVHEATAGIDGMVSLEVSPDLAHDTEATIREARDLHARLDRPNVMIKVPATEAGLPAIETLIADGIPVNVTLLFALDRYRAVAEAYIRGLEQRRARGRTVAGIASVASFFVSRVDSALDPVLAERHPDLQGRIAVANAKLAYRDYQRIFRDERFARLARLGARPQRLLWASTSTKNPDYPDLLYVENLIGPDTVNTMPPATYEAFRDHGRIERTLDRDVEQAERQLAALSSLDIDFKALTDRLEQEGVAAFAKSFDALLATVETRSAKMVAA